MMSTSASQGRTVPRDLRPLMEEGEIHFMGVGGAGMCALAELVARAGGRVSGCDLRPSAAVRPLEAMGVTVEEGHDPSHLEGAAALVVSAAVPGDHPELQAARDAGIPVLKRAEALGGWVNPGQVLAVAGTHGKTTTTAMLTSILEAAGLDPTGVVGGRVPSWESHLRSGATDLFVVEADEYDRSFLHLKPRVAVVTNLEADHLDVYGSLEGIREAFREFVDGVDPEGAVVACADDPGASSLLFGIRPRPVSYGLSAGSVVRGRDLRSEGRGIRFRVMEHGQDRGLFTLPAPGVHNLRNALGAAAAARRMDVEWAAIREGLAAFPGVERRLQLLGEPQGIRIMDDYAHHPTELKAVLRAVRQAHPDRRIVAVFQPHLFSRTRDFAREFGEALALADQVWVTEIYPAREAPIEGVDGELVADMVRRAGASEVRFHGPLESLAEAVAGELRPGDLCLTMGAGSIEKVAPQLVRALGGTP
jgi:UDP-N-acetylmuramate--alanine ligase